MPELPEIETVKLQLQKVLPGLVITKCSVLHPKVVQGDIKLIEGRKVVGVRRMGKVLIVDLEDDVGLAFHFKMTGQLVYENSKFKIVGGHPTEDFLGPLPSKHTRVIFYLDHGTLFFNDQRLFGWVKIVNQLSINNLPFLDKLGPEPFDIEVTEFTKRLSRLRKPVKLALMDQSIISGVGNIYANDACWEAKINPRRLANTLTRKQYGDLYTGLVKVLKEGIKYGGATAADAKYIDLHGLGGHYQEHFRVYDREGELCLRDDGGIIHRFELGGRGTYFCPKCQK